MIGITEIMTSKMDVKQNLIWLSKCIYFSLSSLDNWTATCKMPGDINVGK